MRTPRIQHGPDLPDEILQHPGLTWGRPRVRLDFRLGKARADELRDYSAIGARGNLGLEDGHHLAQVLL